MSRYRQHHKTSSVPKIWTPINVLGAVLIALVLSSAWHLDPKPVDDHSAEWDEAQQIKDGHAIEDAEAAFQAQVQKLCNTARGPNSEARWLPDGSLACTTRRGVVKAQVQL